MPVLHRYPWLAHWRSTVPAPVETKVKVAGITVPVSSALTGLAIWGLQTYAFSGDLPLPVAIAVQSLVPAAITFVACWLAPHTPRPDLRCAEDGPPEEGGRHALDDSDPQDIPAAEFINPAATRYERGHVQD